MSRKLTDEQREARRRWKGAPRVERKEDRVLVFVGDQLVATIYSDVDHMSIDEPALKKAVDFMLWKRTGKSATADPVKYLRDGIGAYLRAL